MQQPATFHVSVTKGETVSFRFRKTRDTIIQKVELQSNGLKFSPPVKQDADGIYSIDHIFKAKGKYTVHILFDSSYVFTYTVTVT